MFSPNILANQVFLIYFLASNSAVEVLESTGNIFLLKFGKVSFCNSYYLTSKMLNDSFIRCIIN